jgi:hypothetical protein
MTAVTDTEKIRRKQQVIYCYTPFAVFDRFSLYLFCSRNGMASLKKKTAVMVTYTTFQFQPEAAVDSTLTQNTVLEISNIN